MLPRPHLDHPHRIRAPYGSVFAVDPSAATSECYLRHATPYDRIRRTLFNHATEGVGVAPIRRWRAILAQAREEGGFLGVDPDRLPRALASFVRFHRELGRLPRRLAADPLPMAELETFLATQDGPVSWS